MRQSSVVVVVVVDADDALCLLRRENLRMCSAGAWAANGVRAEKNMGEGGYLVEKIV